MAKESRERYKKELKHLNTLLVMYARDSAFCKIIEKEIARVKFDLNVFDEMMRAKNSK